MTIRIDTLGPTPHGMWRQGHVRVNRVERLGRVDRLWIHRNGTGLNVTHNLAPDELNDDVAELIADRLDASSSGGQADFELVFTGIVRSTVPGPFASWLRFYRNSLVRLEDGRAAFAPVHQRAHALIVGQSVVDLGSCFGFFPLRLAAAGLEVVATDISASTMALLDGVAPALGRALLTLACDAAAVPLPDRCVDTVTVLHLLEHLSPVDAQSVVTEAMRLARRRVVVAVPFEDTPRAIYGHIQRFDLDALRRLGVSTGWRYSVDEYHGGWLVLDR
ncbi:mycofactocin oligosaccharide methyltransferase MftM [Antrihabitans stalactiti]|uniref:Class I SAM-dependent methyltransferase n=1 Tax=Antrihabitans stalactiti TaxID=2584121 RepID=A0A848KKK3_9NOCA|nr:mycofactocin oligosaccharide methyltransferase MftM [Antrihabitans stalactiti]NMN98799.1 class I SAM-dependent methyltransferase [Antrihabitans stalactiti]